MSPAGPMSSLRRAGAAVLGVAVLGVAVLVAGCSGDDSTDRTRTSAGSASRADPPASSSSSLAAPTATAPQSATGSATVRISRLTGAATALEPDRSFVQLLRTLRVTFDLVGTAESGAGLIELPITAGSATVRGAGTPDRVRADIEHAGSGLRLTAGAIKVELRDLRFRFGATSSATGTVTVNGTDVVDDAKLFALDTTDLQPVGSGSSVDLRQVGVVVSAELARLLDTSFRTTAFTSTLRVGTATSVLNGS